MILAINPMALWGLSYMALDIFISQFITKHGFTIFSCLDFNYITVCTFTATNYKSVLFVNTKCNAPKAVGGNYHGALVFSTVILLCIKAHWDAVVGKLYVIFTHKHLTDILSYLNSLCMTC